MFFVFLAPRFPKIFESLISNEIKRLDECSPMNDWGLRYSSASVRPAGTRTTVQHVWAKIILYLDEITATWGFLVSAARLLYWMHYTSDLSVLNWRVFKLITVFSLCSDRDITDNNEKWSLALQRALNTMCQIQNTRMSPPISGQWWTYVFWL